MGAFPRRHSVAPLQARPDHAGSGSRGARGVYGEGGVGLDQLFGRWHSRGIARGVADCMDDDLIACNLVEDEKWIRRGRQSADGWIVGADANAKVGEKQTNDMLDTPLNALCSLG